jgi:two-component system CheB/CheR fusion protein
MGSALEAEGRLIKCFNSSEAFLAAYHPYQAGYLLVDAGLPGMSGLDLIRKLAEMQSRLPAIMITGQGDVKMAVAAMRAGAVDFLEKPANIETLNLSLQRALAQSDGTAKHVSEQQEAKETLAQLTVRQVQIMDLVLAGHPSKNIAADLGISQRTVENHRASIMKKTCQKSLPGLARLAITAEHQF